MELVSEITALGYLGISSKRTEDWSSYATNLLGMQLADRGGSTRAFRMDDRKQRLLVTGEGEEGLAFMGWEVANAGALDCLAARLDAQGVKTRRGSRALADERHVADLILFADPSGNQLEAFHGAAVAEEPFHPGRSISGFRTGPLGMGHAVLNVGDANALLPFYRDLLGFQISDYGIKPYPRYFFHVNNRHHSFAMVSSGKSGLHHFMVEYCQLDDVGQGYDLAQLEESRLAWSLGRHCNDHITSFYSHTPSAFFVESGWGGRLVDPATWEPQELFDGPSLWGHERLYMEEGPERAHLRMLRLNAAARGVRAPVSLPDCPWAQQWSMRETSAAPTSPDLAPSA